MNVLLRKLRRTLGRAVVVGALFGAPVTIGSLLFTLPLAAQTDSLRTVDGKVLNKDNQPVKGAVVYLKDDHALSVKSYIAGDDGSFHFGQLSSGTDYTLWAEDHGKKSSNKTISSFDNRNKFDETLTIK